MTFRSSILFVIALVAGTAFSCSKNTTTGTGDSVTKTFLALGDSYTIGELVQENQRFAAQTAILLQKEKITIPPITYIAKTGWRTDQLLTSIEATNLNPKYDVVTLLAGVNDQYQNIDSATYRVNFTALVSKAIALAGNQPAHVFVLSMPDYSATPVVPNENKATVSQEIDIFNAINKEIAGINQCVYLDITPSTRLMLNDTTLIAEDGLHPTGKEYAVWAAMLAPLINSGVK